MYLSEIFESLIHGELADVNIGEDKDTFEIVGEYAPLVNHINVGLTALFKRFPLRFNEIWIQEFESRKNYPILEKYAVSKTYDPDNPVDPLVPTSDNFILDSVNAPFIGNVIQLEQVEQLPEDETEKKNDIIRLNDSTAYDVYLLNGPVTLHIEYPTENKQILVKYREKLPKIPNVDLNPETYEVDLPDAYLQALLYYVAFRVHASYPALEGTSESDKFLQKYEMECTRLESEGLANRSFIYHTKLEIRGWP
jgi:hypothetical protein